MVESVKFIKIKGPRETKEPGFYEEFLPEGRNLTKLENLRKGCGGCNAWKMRHARALLGLFIITTLGRKLWRGGGGGGEGHDKENC